MTELKASDVLLKWTESALAEHGLTGDDIFSSTSDSGSDIKRMFDHLFEAEWAWCVPHMANRALADAVRTHVDPSKSKKQACRAEIKKSEERHGALQHVRENEAKVRRADGAEVA